MKPISYCNRMTFEEKRDRVYVYRYRTPDGAREQFTPGICRICGNPLAVAWRVFDKGKLVTETLPGDSDTIRLNSIMDEKRLCRISDKMILPVTVCDAIADDNIWQAAEKKENERKRAIVEEMTEKPVIKRPAYSGAF